MLTQENYDEAMKAINGCKNGFAMLLSEVPSLVLSSTTIFTRFGNSITQVAAAGGLKVTIDDNIGARPALDLQAKEKLTHIAGRKVKNQKRVSISDAVNPTIKNISDMQLYVNQAEDSLMDLDIKELRDQYGDVTIRALAARLGVDVSPTTAVDNELIRAMKTAKLDAEEKEMQTAKAESTAVSSSAIPAPTTAVDNAAPADVPPAATETTANNTADATTAAAKTTKPGAKK